MDHQLRRWVAAGLFILGRVLRPMDDCRAQARRCAEEARLLLEEVGEEEARARRGPGTP